jgi:hypothetical protein
MKKLSLLSSITVALVCAAVPASFNWPSANVTPISVDRAEARIGRPLTPMSVAGVSRRVHRRAYRRAIVAGAAVGTAAVVGAAAGEPIPGPPAAPSGSPYAGPGYGYGPGPYPDTVIVNPVTGRWCRTEPGGFQWCWTP